MPTACIYDGVYGCTGMYTGCLELQEDVLYTLAMYDAYGDGWQGAQFALVSMADLNMLGPFELHNGSSSQQRFTVDNVFGCTDPNDVYYNAAATMNDGSCQVLGCTDLAALNYNPNANDDDGSCEMPTAGCMDSYAENFDPEARIPGPCEYTCSADQVIRTCRTGGNSEYGCTRSFDVSEPTLPPVPCATCQEHIAALLAKRNELQEKVNQQNSGWF